MQTLLKTGAALILITGSTSSISGAAEASCTQPAPATLQQALQAKPPSAAGVVAYEEIITHPAFGTAVKNTGVFEVSRDNLLLRRQITPKAEQMTIGAKTITITRKGHRTTRAIPPRMATFFSVLQAAVFNTDLPQLHELPHRLSADAAGWIAQVSLRKNRGGTITFSGCGAVLRSIDLKMAGNQDRQIRFLTP